MNKKFVILVGESGSGKTTIAEYLEKEHGWKQVRSYTERRMRYHNEPGHTFVTSEEFDKLKDIVAFTCYNGNRYCTTKEQVEECDIAVIDVAGVKAIRRLYHGSRKIVVIYVNVPMKRRLFRLIKRGDGLKNAIERIRYDKNAFAEAAEICDYTVYNKNLKEAAMLVKFIAEH